MTRLRLTAAALAGVASLLIAPATAAADPKDQGWRNCGSWLIGEASVNNTAKGFKVNLYPTLPDVPKPPLGIAWSDLRNCVSFPNLDTLRHQFDCHAVGNVLGDPQWNLESWRKPNGDWWKDAHQHKCNWGGGGSSS